jgi:beta-glucanase (GH16 family)
MAATSSGSNDRRWDAVHFSCHFGFVFRTPKWQDWREVDIEVTERSARFLQTNVLNGDNQTKYNSSFASFKESPLAHPIDDGYHVYVLEWLPNTVAFYLDPDRNPVPVRRLGPNATFPVPDRPGKLMMNLWTFNHPQTGKYPMISQIDYVRYYKADLEDGPYPCSDAPACLGPSDLDYSKNNANDGIPPTKSGYPNKASDSITAGRAIDIDRMP